MLKKVLFCATLDIHFKKFHLPYLKWFKEQGWEVHVVSYGDLSLPYVDQKHHINIQRAPFNKNNIQAYKELKTLMDEQTFNLIHCHTPMGGVLARLAARHSRKRGTKVIYTAHGFHFCKGSALINWILYYPIERFFAHYTDCLITINDEDYLRAIKHRFAAGSIERVHGVGVDTVKFKPAELDEKSNLRNAMGYRSEHFLLFYAAEFNLNKNQRLLIEAFAHIKEKIPNARLLLAGDGPLFDACKELAVQKGVADKVDFLGYQEHIESFIKISDLAVASSFREGLPVNVMEAMACGLPILASRNRGHIELIQDGLNGYTVSTGDVQQFAAKLLELYQFKRVGERMGSENRQKVNAYSLDVVGSELKLIYSRYMVGDLKGVSQHELAR